MKHPYYVTKAKQLYVEILSSFSVRVNWWNLQIIIWSKPSNTMQAIGTRCRDKYSIIIGGNTSQPFHL